jgi:hypothetical protein
VSGEQRRGTEVVKRADRSVSLPSRMAESVRKTVEERGRKESETNERMEQPELLDEVFDNGRVE